MSPRLSAILLLLGALLVGAGWYFLFGGRPVATQVIPLTNSPTSAVMPLKPGIPMSNSAAPTHQNLRTPTPATSQPVAQPLKPRAPLPYLLGSADSPPQM